MTIQPTIQHLIIEAVREELYQRKNRLIVNNPIYFKTVTDAFINPLEVESQQMAWVSFGYGNTQESRLAGFAQDEQNVFSMVIYGVLADEKPENALSRVAGSDYILLGYGSEVDIEQLENPSDPLDFNNERSISSVDTLNKWQLRPNEEYPEAPYETIQEGAGRLASDSTLVVPLKRDSQTPLAAIYHTDRKYALNIIRRNQIRDLLTFSADFQQVISRLVHHLKVFPVTTDDGQEMWTDVRISQVVTGAGKFIDREFLSIKVDFQIAETVLDWHSY